MRAEAERTYNLETVRSKLELSFQQAETEMKEKVFLHHLVVNTCSDNEFFSFFLSSLVLSLRVKGQN